MIRANTHDQSGFSLIELILSIAIIGILTGITSVVYYSLQVKNGLDIAAVSLAQSLRHAELRARGSDSDSAWGVYLQTGSITVFKGTAYASRDQTKDDVVSIPAGITLSGIREVAFAKFTGIPSTTGTITLATTTDSKIVSINSKGLVSL